MMRLIWGNREAKYFLLKIWTTQISLIPFGNFLFTRKAHFQQRSSHGAAKYRRLERSAHARISLRSSEMRLLK
jgi:hypothetical protein